MSLLSRITSGKTTLSKDIRVSQGGPILLGRQTSGAGKAQEIVVGSGLTLSGLTLSADASSAWDDITGKPTEFTPSAHTHTFSSLTSKPTTLAGYGITDTAPTLITASEYDSIVFLGGLADEVELEYDGMFLDRPLFSAPVVGGPGNWQVSWDGVVWGLYGNGILIYNAIGDTALPTDAEWQGSTITLMPVAVNGIAVGQLRRRGASSPYSWYRWDGSVWESIDPPPAVSLTASKVVANAAARLALSAEDAEGFAVVESDTGKSYMLVSEGNPATSGDWLQLGDRDIQWADVGGKPTIPTVDNSSITEALSDAPAASRDAANIERIYNVLDYGASGSWQAPTTGDITSGSPTLTVASAATFEVGQGIYVAGAGTAGARLVTTISAISGTTITLASNAATTVSGAVVQHDDTAAINSATAACLNAGGGTVYFPNGRYRCNGLLNGSTNSVLTMPMYAGFEVTKRTVYFVGESRAKFDKGLTTPVSGLGTLLDFTDVTGVSGTRPAAFAGAPWVTDPGWQDAQALQWNMVEPTFDRMTFFTPQGTLSGINCHNVHGLNIGDQFAVIAKAPRSLLETDFPDYDFLAQGDSYGIIFPAYLNSATLTCGGSSVIGFGTGYELGEHVHLRRPIAWICTTGYLIPKETYFQHLISGDICAESCKWIVVSESPKAIFDLTIQYEGRTGTSFALEYGFKGTGTERGILRYGGLNLSGYQFHPGCFPVLGGAYLRLEDLKNGVSTYGWFTGNGAVPTNRQTGDQQKLSLGDGVAGSAGALTNMKLLFSEDWLGSTQYKTGVGLGPTGVEFNSKSAITWDFWSNNVNKFSIGTTGSLTANGGLTIKPPASVTPASNGQLTFEATSNTSLTIKLKGSDGTVRSVVLTLAP